VASGLTPDVRVHRDADSLAAATATALLETIGAAAAGGAGCSLALAGGTTPGALYRRLGSAPPSPIGWGKVEIFWGDERYVPPEDPRSNYRMAKEAWLDRAAIPPESIHPMPTHFGDPNEAASAYEATMRGSFAGTCPRFNIILLGLGADGHTASLFPGSPALAERSRWVVAAKAPADPPVRLTLTLPVLNNAERVWFLVSGKEKAPALARVLAMGKPEEFGPPAAAVRPANGTVVWWVDQAAAALLNLPGRTPGPDG